jgi:hypothetical protein
MTVETPTYLYVSFLTSAWVVARTCHGEHVRDDPREPRDASKSDGNVSCQNGKLNARLIDRMSQGCVPRDTAETPRMAHIPLEEYRVAIRTFHVKPFEL